MPASAELVERSGDLKAALVEYGEGRRFARHLDKALDQYLASGLAADEAELANAVDRFILEYRLPDGKTVVEMFVEEHVDLTDEERTLLLGWRDVVEGIFQVDRREGQALILTNLVDELTYRARSNVGPAAVQKMRTGSFLITRLVPIEDEWLLSGISSIYPSSYRQEIYRAAADIALRNPALVFRNPEKLEQGWELQRKEQRGFVEFFGTDLVVAPGSEIEARMQAYMHFRTHEMRDENGKSAADRSRDLYGAEPPEIAFTLPAEMTEADTVGVIYDEVEGMLFLRNFARMEERFARPELATDDRYRQTALGYLRDPDLSPLPFRRLAERDPERASRVFALLLKRPDFSWDRDGEALLRQYKPDYFEQPPLPSVAPVSPRLARVQLARPEPDAAAPRRHHQPQSAQRAKRRAKRRAGRSR
jgi:hypothetical protein